MSYSPLLTSWENILKLVNIAPDVNTEILSKPDKKKKRKKIQREKNTCITANPLWYWQQFAWFISNNVSQTITLNKASVNDSVPLTYHTRHWPQSKFTVQFKLTSYSLYLNMTHTTTAGLWSIYIEQWFILYSAVEGRGGLLCGWVTV